MQHSKGTSLLPAVTLQQHVGRLGFVTEEQYVQNWMSNEPNFKEWNKDKRYRWKCDKKAEYYRDYLYPRLIEVINSQNRDVTDGASQLRLVTKEEYVESWKSNEPNFRNWNKDKRYREKCRKEEEYYRDYLCLILITQHIKIPYEQSSGISAEMINRSDNEMPREESIHPRQVDEIPSDSNEWIDELLATDEQFDEWHASYITPEDI